MSESFLNLKAQIQNCSNISEIEDLLGSYKVSERTENIRKVRELAEKLGVDFNDLMGKPVRKAKKAEIPKDAQIISNPENPEQKYRLGSRGKKPKWFKEWEMHNKV